MTPVCETVREQLADDALDAAGRQHLVACAACRSIAEALGEVDAALVALPRLDAPDALAEATLARVRAEDREAREGPDALGAGSLLGAALGVVVAALVALVTAPWVLVRGLRDRLARPVAQTAREDEARGEQRAPRASSSSRPPRRVWMELALVTGILGVVVTASWQRFGNMVKGKIDGSTSTLDAMPRSGSEQSVAEERSWAADEGSTGVGGGQAWQTGVGHRGRPAAVASAPPPPPSAGVATIAPATTDFQQGQGPVNGTWATDRSATLALVTPEVVNGTDVGDEDDGRRFHGDGAESENGRWARNQEGRDQGIEGDHLQLRQSVVIDDELEGEVGGEPHGEPHGEPSRVPSRELNDEPNDAPNDAPRADRRGRLATQPTGGRASAWSLAQETSGLTIHVADGWWLNTYVPGDPATRQIAARLAAHPRTLAGTSHSALAFAEAVMPPSALLEAPRDRALAVGAFADAASIDGPTRVRVEIALRSVSNAAGRRGALRVAVVLDARAPLDAQSEARVRSLVAALSSRTTSRDQVALYAAGSGGGRLVPLGPMRAGPVEVALRRLFGARDETSAVAMDVAVSDALEAVSDPDGVGLVLLLTPGDARDAATERAIHIGTVAGITTTAVGLGAGASLDGLDAIALAGQGRRRLALDDASAREVVRAELGAASELVARALRVHVRLAEGVQLVDVLGSRPLDAEETLRTREVERAIDQQLAARLGIAADRDEDDDGLRIAIPAFYADDAHAIVLDLLVSRPGCVLDVDVALKDMVRVGNARASASLTLPGGRRARGPRELRVLADTLGLRTSLALRDAVAAVEANDVARADAALEQMAAMWGEASAEVPELDALPSAVADRSLLQRSRALLRADWRDPQLLDALRYAAVRRVSRPRLAVVE